jgi:hypothetical protein
MPLSKGSGFKLGHYPLSDYFRIARDSIGIGLRNTTVTALNSSIGLLPVRSRQE